MQLRGFALNLIVWLELYAEKLFFLLDSIDADEDDIVEGQQAELGNTFEGAYQT